MMRRAVRLACSQALRPLEYTQGAINTDTPPQPVPERQLMEWLYEVLDYDMASNILVQLGDCDDYADQLALVQSYLPRVKELHSLATPSLSSPPIGGSRLFTPRNPPTQSVSDRLKQSDTVAVANLPGDRSRQSQLDLAEGIKHVVDSATTVLKLASYTWKDEPNFFVGIDYPFTYYLYDKMEANPNLHVLLAIDSHTLPYLKREYKSRLGVLLMAFPSQFKFKIVAGAHDDKGLQHMKMAISDSCAYIGSGNFTDNSMNHCWELGVVTSNNTVIQEAAAVYDMMVGDVLWSRNQELSPAARNATVLVPNNGAPGKLIEGWVHSWQSLQSLVPEHSFSIENPQTKASVQLTESNFTLLWRWDVRSIYAKK
eukprot:TRINITY_DN21114_c0_g1_i1.p1 TRINITY_DN21114_c0_g1~~TRINITY_DN21114_c0_g1_i1.p1  ORF type:complete len:379 (+),score=4.70 TRINITY_DN21114_c0_g1_i1:30-1139(+)